MKDLLILYPKIHHTNLIEGQCECLKEQGMSADALLIKMEGDKIVFLNFCQAKVPLKFLLYTFLFNIINKIKGFNRFGLKNKLIILSFNSIFKGYRIIEFAGIYNTWLTYFARRVKDEQKNLVIRLWDHYIRDWQKELFILSDVINVGNDCMKQDFLSLYPQFSNKIVTVPYGNDQIEILNDLLEGKIKKDISFLDPNAHGKTIITVGYSGRAWHQHFYIIDAIEKLPDEIKKEIFLLFPMTYSNSGKDYIGYLRERVMRTGIPFQFLKNHLSIIQNMSMRIISDVVINCQVDDSLSSSIKEHLMAGSVLIAGDWLPYKLFRKYGAYLHDTSLGNLSSTLKLVLENLEREKEKCKENKQILYTFSSWKYKGEKYKEIYYNL